MDYLIGHLIGDYLLQSDWQANNKTYENRKWVGLLIALYHAALWTFAIWISSIIAKENWTILSLIIMWLFHAFQDWTRFPKKFIEKRNQFAHFRDNAKDAYIWACILVDNIFHLLMLFLLRELL